MTRRPPPDLSRYQAVVNAARFYLEVTTPVRMVDTGAVMRMVREEQVVRQRLVEALEKLDG